jgi:acyl-CoA synthetase (AMP-forming)/AMP-acid ligase II
VNHPTTFTGPPLATEPGMGALTLGGLLAQTADRHAGREAICFHERDGSVVRWTYAELHDRARRVAKAIVATGAGKGTRVALLMGNRPEWVSAAFGVALTGGVLVPVNTLFEAPELDHVLRHSDAAVLLYQERLARHRYHEQIRALLGSLPYLSTLACFGTAGDDDFLARGDALDDGVLDRRAAEVSEHDDALVLYTSGTTGKPKGVLQAHRAAAIQSWRFARHLCLEPTARVWSAFPFFWTAGFCMVMGATLAAGGCLVLQELFEPGEALRLLEAERVTTPHAWTHQLAALESHPDWLRRDLSSLRQVDAFNSLGRHPSVALDTTWSPRAAYGLTETFTIISSMPADTPAAEREGHEGVVLPGNSVRIVDAVTGVAQPVGMPGEIRVKGPTLMKGYLKVAPEEVFDPDGYFPTGDAGFVDDEGHLHWVGRTSDLIKTGGANVSPVEIENELLPHPGLRSALAVGVPHPTLGQIVVVCAVAQPGWDLDEDGVREFLRGKIASYKLPRRVLFFGEDELVLTGNAKIRAEDLRNLAADRLAHSENAF